MPSFLFLFFITILFGVGNVLLKKGFRNLTAWQTYAFDAIFIAFPLWMGYGILNGGDLSTVTALAVLNAFIITIVYGIYYYTLYIGQIGLTSSIVATYPIFTVILAFFILEEKLSLAATVGVFLSIFGVILISLPKKVKITLEKWVLLSLFCAVAFGITSFTSKIALQSVNNATYLMLLAIGQVIVVSIWKLFNKEKFPPFKFKTIGVSALAIILLNIGNIFYYIALEKGFVSIVVPLSNTYVIITVILSIIWLKEKIYFRQIIGIAGVVIGVILVGLNTHSSTKLDTKHSQQPPRPKDDRPLAETTNHQQIILSPTPTMIRERTKVAFVLDGDTIELIDKRRIRYIGINTPEINLGGGKPECFAADAAKVNKELVVGQEIEMEKDVSQTDKYGRLLRYVYIDGLLINDFLLRLGYARLELIPPDTHLSQQFKEAEKEAIENKRGLWRECKNSY